MALKFLDGPTFLEGDFSQKPSIAPQYPLVFQNEQAYKKATGQPLNLDDILRLLPDLNPLKLSTETVTAIGHGLARLGYSAASAVANPFGEKTERPAYLPESLGGPLESYQAEAKRRVESGESATSAFLKTGGQAILDEPVGIAFKPLLIGVGLLGKQLFSKALSAADKVIADTIEKEGSIVIRNVGKPEGKITELGIHKVVPDSPIVYDKSGLSHTFDTALSDTKSRRLLPSETIDVVKAPDDILPNFDRGAENSYLYVKKKAPNLISIVEVVDDGTKLRVTHGGFETPDTYLRAPTELRKSILEGRHSLIGKPGETPVISPKDTPVVSLSTSQEGLPKPETIMPSDTLKSSEAAKGGGGLGGPPGELPVEGLADESGGNAIQKLIAAIKGAAKPRAALEEAYTTERATRAAKASEVMEQGKGQKGYFETLGKLAGELAPDKKSFEPLTDIGQSDVDSLFNQIQLSPNLDVYERVTAANGLQKILGGQIPQKSQLALLEDIFGSDLINAVQEHKTFAQKLGQILADTLNIPRSLITSFDMSAPLRQGILLTTAKPVVASKAFKEMFRQVFSQENFDKWLADIPNNPLYKDMKSSGLYISNPNKISGGLTAREESFMSNLAEKIPIMGQLVKASSRAYISFLNKLRVDVFTQLANEFREQGIATPQNLKSLAEYVNNSTGRGSLGGLERSAVALNNLLFSPRLIASRFNALNPIWYAKQTPPVRREAIKNMAKFIGVGGTVLAIAAANGAKIELDPRSTDFGKIRVGNSRWDIWGGFQQWVRVFSQLASGAKKTQTGDIVELSGKKYPFTTRFDTALQFGLGKLAPIPSLVQELMQGQKTFGGELKLSDQMIQNTVPLYLQDMKDAIDEIGPEAIFTAGVPAFFGVGFQNYKERKGKMNF